jgi:hypothetical protein
MKEAYMAASNNNTLPATAQQVFYQARPKIMELTERPPNRVYFTQTLLPDYIEAHPRECVDWDVVFDARGHILEPHTNLTVGLGTLEVRNYLSNMLQRAQLVLPRLQGARVHTVGPADNFLAVLFIEKEGFLPLLKRVNLADRRDIAIMSTKGTSVTAARKLADEMCAIYRVPLLVLHDCDFAGYIIRSTLQRDTRRYRFRNEFELIDLGLRLKDVEDLELESEPAAPRKMSEDAATEVLENNGAPAEEVEFLLEQRVELNALPSADLVEFIEQKLDEHSIEKVVPERATLEHTYRTFARDQQLQQAFKQLRQTLPVPDIKVPKNLEQKVEDILEQHDDLRWDEAVQIVLDENRLQDMRQEKREAKKRAGNFMAGEED